MSNMILEWSIRGSRGNTDYGRVPVTMTMEVFPKNFQRNNDKLNYW